MRLLLINLVVAVVALLPAVAADRPNIVVVLCDDLGYGDLACYGHPHIKTPNLDLMADEGARFTSCYSAAPVCSPSRVGLMTGRSPNRAGVYDWIPPAGPNTKRDDARDKVQLKADAITIPKLLGEAGYATCLSGKWHCNARFNSPSQAQPGDVGFDHWFATQNNAAPSHANPVNYVRNGEPVGKIEGYSCQIATDEAIGWMADKGAPGTDQPPFFLYLAFHEPHEPVASPADLVAGYKDVARSQKEAEYFANVENVDRAVGKLLTALVKTGKDANTLVIFTSDNGPETLDRYKSADRSFGRATPLRGMKLWTTDAGFRVAGIARWPGRIDPGQVIDTPVSSLDFLPTFCGIAGTGPASDHVLDGTDLSPLFEGGQPERPSPLIWVYYNAINEERAAMRHGDWKVLATLDAGGLAKTSNVNAGNAENVKAAALGDFEIYRITGDIGESKNLVDSLPADERDRLITLFQSQYAELVADSPVWE